MKICFSDKIAFSDELENLDLKKKKLFTCRRVEFDADPSSRSKFRWSNVSNDTAVTVRSNHNRFADDDPVGQGRLDPRQIGTRAKGRTFVAGVVFKEKKSKEIQKNFIFGAKFGEE